MNKAYGWIRFQNLFEFEHLTSRRYILYYKGVFYGKYGSKKLAMQYLNKLFLSCIYHGEHYTKDLYDVIMSDIDKIIEENKNRYICPNSSFFVKYRFCDFDKNKFIELYLANRRIKLGKVLVKGNFYKHYKYYIFYL